jgi:hypothetical protein
MHSFSPNFAIKNLNLMTCVATASTIYETPPYTSSRPPAQPQKEESPPRCSRLVLCPSSLFESIFLSFVKQIRLRRSQVYNFWTTVTILSLLDTFSAVVRIRNTLITTYGTAAFQTSIVAFVACVNQCMRIHERVTDAT